MSMRTFSALLILALAGCGQPAPDTHVIAAVEAEASARAADQGKIDCAVGDAEFARVCTLDRAQIGEGVILTARQPDGGFHRLRLTTDGRGVVAADGAETAKVSVIGPDRIEVAIGSARYRLPAKVGPLPAK